jgi:hypothetical protein
MCYCQDKPKVGRATDREDPQVIMRKLAKTGTRLLHDLPTIKECGKIENESARTFVMALRNVALHASQAQGWDKRELESFATSMALADSLAEAVLGAVRLPCMPRGLHRNVHTGGGGDIIA